MDSFGFLGSQFPPGFRFHPTDQELIIHYLRNKVTSSLTFATSIIADIDLYKFNPWELPGKAFFGEGEWFFFSPRDRKYPNGARPNRAAGSGYWKATGTDKPIIATGGSQCLGVKKALVFYKGRPPKGIKTDWLMHEYRLLDDKSSSTWNQKPKGSMRLDDWVLCRVRQKGSIPTETEEKSETSGLINPSPNQNTSKQPESKEKSDSLYEWSDYQLLAYLLNSQEGGESGYEDSDLGSKKFSGTLNSTDRGFTADQEDQPQQISSMLNSIKRTLSFGILDEMMLMPPGKRLHFSSGIEEQSSPSESVSFEQTYSELLL